MKRTLTDIEGAANFLLIKWPREWMDSELHQLAQVAALEALGRKASPAAFRNAFIAAALEADSLAPEDRPPEKALPAHVARPWRVPTPRAKRRPRAPGS